MPSAAYVELPPPAALAPWVRCLWAARLGPCPKVVVPDACTDVIVAPGSPPAIAGPQTEAVWPALPVGTEIVGIRFSPGLAAAALGLPVDLLRDATPRLDQVWGAAGDELGERVAATGSLPAALAVVERAFLVRLPVLRPGDPRVTAAVERLALPRARVGELGGDLGLSERQLHRRVSQAVGYGPKTLERVLRFQRFLALADRTPWRLAALAHAAGYADQAHLSRDCRRLSGLTPSALLAQRSRPVSDPFKTGLPEPSTLPG